jgi:sarcosine oxidase delta subunit
MSFLLRCPECGLRDVSEFRYGGQIPGPAAAGANLPEIQNERWYHRYGCRRWLVVRRDIRNNQVVHSSWLGEEAG